MLINQKSLHHSKNSVFYKDCELECDEARIINITRFTNLTKDKVLAALLNNEKIITHFYSYSLVNADNVPVLTEKEAYIEEVEEIIPETPYHNCGEIEQTKQSLTEVVDSDTFFKVDSE